jgi:DNA polymerase-4
MATLREFGVVEVLGWDEAFLVTEDMPEVVAEHIQRRVRESTELDCTVGIGQNKLQAKLATGFGKPAGIFRLTYDNWFEILGDRSADALWGIGTKTAKRLSDMGIRTVRQLAVTHPDVVAAQMGPTMGPWLVRIARGVSSARVTGAPYVARSRGRETTFQQNLTDWDDVRRELVRLARRVAADVVSEGRPAGRIVVKVRYAPFFTHTHGHTLAEPTTDVSVIEKAAMLALDWFNERSPIRLLGVRAEFVEKV